MLKKAKTLIPFFLITALTGCAGSNPAAEVLPTPTEMVVATVAPTPIPIPKPTTTVMATDAPVTIAPTDNATATPVANAPGGFFAEADVFAVMRLSEAAASAVWQYGGSLGWVDMYGWAHEGISPEVLALSQAAYRQTLIYWCWENPINHADAYALEIEEWETRYAQILFPGVAADALPETDAFSEWAWGVNILEQANAAQAFFAAGHVGREGGYVIVRCLSVRENQLFEDFYRVDWEKDNVAEPFGYKLAGVYPMERYLLGGSAEGRFVDRYLNAEAEAALDSFGITHPIGYMERWGAWGAGNNYMIKTIAEQDGGEIITYILVDDDEYEDNIVYVAALDDAEEQWLAPVKLLTALQAREILNENGISEDVFYPGELDIWEDEAPWYGFSCSGGEETFYAWVNAVTGEVSTAEKVEDYTRTGEEY